MMHIPLARPYFDHNEIEEIETVLKSGWVSQGPKVQEFENKIAQYLGARFAVATSSCTSALHLALLSIGIDEGDEVLVADFTFPATGHAVLYCRGHPIFVDVDINTYNILPESIEEKINDKTKAIIPVHTFGQPAQMNKVMAIAKSYDLKVIEDAACALGAKYDTSFAGTIGDVGCFSFHARKGITCGEGGMIITNDRDIAKKARSLSVFGISTAWDRNINKGFEIPEFKHLGYNYKLSDVAAAIGVAQLGKLERIIERKRELAKYWNEKLAELDHIIPPQVDEKALHIYQSYVALVDATVNRNDLITELLKRGIQTQIGTYASHIQPVYKSTAICPNSYDVFSRSIALPIYFDLKYEDIDFVTSTIKNLIER